MSDQPSEPRRGRLPRLFLSTTKLACLAGLAIATLVPTSMISSLITERETNEAEAKAAVARSWGPAQVVSGPTVMMASTSAAGGNGHATSDRLRTTYVRVAPAKMSAEIDIEPERRHRGFFDVTVFRATLRLKGMFAIPETMRGADGTSVTLPNDGFLAVTLDSFAGVANADQAGVGTRATPWQVMEETGGAACRGRGKTLVVPATFGTQRSALPFEATLHLRGTGSAQLAVLAKELNATMKGAWASPSFVGDEPPVRAATTAKSFEATWQADSIGAPRVTASDCVAESPAGASRIGVELVDPVSIYRMVTRAAKYAPLFITLAFAAYFLFELMSGITITIVQYGLMAASLSLFALLLVSIGEFTGYTPAYVISALLVVGQASVFTSSVTRRIRPALGFAALLSGLFGFLYVLLGLEALALLAGSLALFVVLCAVMVVTQRVHRRGEIAA